MGAMFVALLAFGRLIGLPLDARPVPELVVALRVEAPGHAADAVEASVTELLAEAAAHIPGVAAVRDAIAGAHARTPAELGAVRLARAVVSDVAVVTDGQNPAGCVGYRADHVVVLGTIRRTIGSDAATVRAALAERLAAFAKTV